MPTYDYKCDACGNTWEQFQSMSAAPTKRCPKCGKNKARRLIGTGAGLIFKGSGFYITDYRDAGYKDKAKAESGAAPDAKSGGDAKPSTDAAATKSETKSDTKSDAAPAPAKTENKSAKSSAAKRSSKRGG
jgi:putative FmdB family regulatory protein